MTEVISQFTVVMDDDDVIKATNGGVAVILPANTKALVIQIRVSEKMKKEGNLVALSK